ncbi:hypothetical protein KJ969_05300, partial [Patescibacteria group bacterium]|nr:hypothetical protein [Patescibacteria group bacterium]
MFIGVSYAGEGSGEGFVKYTSDVEYGSTDDTALLDTDTLNALYEEAATFDPLDGVKNPTNDTAVFVKSSAYKILTFDSNNRLLSDDIDMYDNQNGKNKITKYYKYDSDDTTHTYKGRASGWTEYAKHGYGYDDIASVEVSLTYNKWGQVSDEDVTAGSGWSSYKEYTITIKEVPDPDYHGDTEAPLVTQVYVDDLLICTVKDDGKVVWSATNFWRRGFYTTRTQIKDENGEWKLTECTSVGNLVEYLLSTYSAGGYSVPKTIPISIGWNLPVQSKKHNLTYNLLGQVTGGDFYSYNLDDMKAQWSRKSSMTYNSQGQFIAGIEGGTHISNVTYDEFGGETSRYIWGKGFDGTITHENTYDEKGLLTESVEDRQINYHPQKKSGWGSFFALVLIAVISYIAPYAWMIYVAYVAAAAAAIMAVVALTGGYTLEGGGGYAHKITKYIYSYSGYDKTVNKNVIKDEQSIGSVVWGFWRILELVITVTLAIVISIVSAGVLTEPAMAFVVAHVTATVLIAKAIVAVALALMSTIVTGIMRFVMADGEGKLSEYITWEDLAISALTAGVGVCLNSITKAVNVIVMPYLKTVVKAISEVYKTVVLAFQEIASAVQQIVVRIFSNLVVNGEFTVDPLVLIAALASAVINIISAQLTNAVGMLGKAWRGIMDLLGDAKEDILELKGRDAGFLFLKKIVRGTLSEIARQQLIEAYIAEKREKDGDFTAKHLNKSKSPWIAILAILSFSTTKEISRDEETGEKDTKRRFDASSLANFLLDLQLIKLSGYNQNTKTEGSAKPREIGAKFFVKLIGAMASNLMNFFERLMSGIENGVRNDAVLNHGLVGDPELSWVSPVNGKEGYYRVVGGDIQGDLVVVRFDAGGIFESSDNFSESGVISTKLVREVKPCHREESQLSEQKKPLITHIIEVKENGKPIVTHYYNNESVLTSIQRHQDAKDINGQAKPLTDQKKEEIAKSAPDIMTEISSKELNEDIENPNKIDLKNPPEGVTIVKVDFTDKNSKLYQLKTADGKYSLGEVLEFMLDNEALDKNDAYAAIKDRGEDGDYKELEFYNEEGESTGKKGLWNTKTGEAVIYDSNPAQDGRTTLTYYN